jgi:recombination protein RecR
MKYTSRLIEEAVEALSLLPSIGKKSALRLVLYLLSQNKDKSDRISKAIHKLSTEIKSCQKCHAYADTSVCSICADSRRSKKVICVVESVRDLMAIEETQQYNGTYHILGGLISPLDGRGPDDIHIASLIHRVSEDQADELIMAISPTIEGETTIYYISRLLAESNVRISVISRGVSFAGELEYADELTLGRSIQSRIPYHQKSLSSEV